MPVLKTQTCNWNHLNSFHKLFRTHTTHFAQPRYPQRSFFSLLPHNPLLRLHYCAWTESKSTHSLKLMCPVNVLPEVKGIKDWLACVDEKIRSFISRCNADECWALSPVAMGYQVAKHSAFGLQRLTSVSIWWSKSNRRYPHYVMLPWQLCM